MSAPKTGRAVTAAGAGDWADRLLPLPAGLLGGGPVDRRRRLAQGLRLTGHFLTRELTPGAARPAPARGGRLAPAGRAT